MYSKADIFNLALGALLLSKRIVNPDSDPSTENKVLGTHWNTALATTLQEMDLDSTSTQFPLELLTTYPYQTQTADGIWQYAYKYPSKCMLFRRIYSGAAKDNRYTHIPKRVAMYNGQKVIFTNSEMAVAEFIPSDLPLNSLSPSAGLAIAYKLALLAAPLVTGKGAKSLMETIDTKYKIARAEAQAQDQLENFSYYDDSVDSEFVAERMS